MRPAARSRRWISSCSRTIGSIFRPTRPCRWFAPALLLQHPEVGGGAAALEGAISAAEMRRMNYAVDGEKQDPFQVVRAFLDRIERFSELMPSLDSFQDPHIINRRRRHRQHLQPARARDASFRASPGCRISLKILLENLLRREDNAFVKTADIRALASWDPKTIGEKEMSFMPARVLLQDFTGVPCVVDLAAMRDGIVALGGDPQKVNPLQPVELVIDHSVQVDHFGTANALGAQRRPRVPPQSRALRVPALGPDRVPQLPRRAARDRHRAPGQHRIPRARRLPRRRGRRRDRLSRHRVRHRLAHDDGERPGRGGMGRRRHRSRGRDARPAELDADSAGARLSPDGQAARRRDRDRPGADDHRSDPQEGRGRQVRRVLRTRPGAPDDCRSRRRSATCAPSTAPPSRSSRSTT